MLTAIEIKFLSKIVEKRNWDIQEMMILRNQNENFNIKIEQIIVCATRVVNTIHIA